MLDTWPVYMYSVFVPIATHLHLHLHVHPLLHVYVWSGSVSRDTMLIVFMCVRLYVGEFPECSPRAGYAGDIAQVPQLDSLGLHF